MYGVNKIIWGLFAFFLSYCCAFFFFFSIYKFMLLIVFLKTVTAENL